MSMQPIEHEPVIAAGLMAGIKSVGFELKGVFTGSGGERFDGGSYRTRLSGDEVEIVSEAGRLSSSRSEHRLTPIEPSASFVIRGITIGIDFHWEQREDLQFHGALRFKVDDGELTVINDIPIEAYLASVVSSEMSAESPPELLKAHSIISRSWLLAQIDPWKKVHQKPSFTVNTVDGVKQLIRWYDRENHAGFDVCADDHCQRYQGITRATSPEVYEAVRETCGQVLFYDGELCDARYSKSCGGMTESYGAAWEEAQMPYLTASYDGERFPSEFDLPLTDEANAEKWIRSSPPAFCNVDDKSIIGRILPDFDQETSDFYRWRVVIAQEELQELLRKKLGVDFGAVRKLEAVERGASGRLVRLRIVGERETMIVGKELEIRRALSPSHLYSSAFVVEADEQHGGAPSHFKLIGAGWGHGVGLCQIGAALMAERGYDFRQILDHYYRGAQLYKLYSAGG